MDEQAIRRPWRCVFRRRARENARIRCLLNSVSGSRACLTAYFERAVIHAFLDAGIACEAKKSLRYDVLRGVDRAQRAMAPDLICNLADGPLIVDAKFKHNISSANLQQMVTYCVLTGARRAVLVLPADGEFDDAYVLPVPDGRSIEVRIVGLDTLGCTVSAWREHGATMVRRAVGSTGTARAHGHPVAVS